jgi:hypothetical protein
MLPTITTTHAIPKYLPTGIDCHPITAVRCSYCLEFLGEASDLKRKIQLEKAHRCKAKRLVKRPAAAVPYN